MLLLLSAPRAHAYPTYHDISDTAAAESEARERHLPIAYLGCYATSLSAQSPAAGSSEELCQMALATLQGNAVVIAFDGTNMAPVPVMVHAQYHIQDDGPLDGKANWLVPKIVFANPDISKTLGRVSETQMAAGRATPLYVALQAIRDNPSALDPRPTPPPQAAASPVRPSDSATDDATTATPDDTLANSFARLTGMTNKSLYQVGGGILVVAIFFSLVRRMWR